jgi:hypothetical protein
MEEPEAVVRLMSLSRIIDLGVRGQTKGSSTSFSPGREAWPTPFA